jgi:hypothetical protein
MLSGVITFALVRSTPERPAALAEPPPDVALEKVS